VIHQNAGCSLALLRMRTEDKDIAHCAYAKETNPPLPMTPRIKITAVRKPFDPEAFAAVLVAAALARLEDEAKRRPAPKPPRQRPGGGQW